MLTADLVNARRRGTELHLMELDAAARIRAVSIAAALLEIVTDHVGRTREELEAAVEAVDVAPREQRTKAGLAKLIEDRCEFDADESLDPETLRRDVFTRAAATRAALEIGQSFDRTVVLDAVAKERGALPSVVERALFADLRAAHVLRTFEPITAHLLVALFERAQAQAVLLRAVKVTALVRCVTPGAMRSFFRRLKFLRLLHTITPLDHGHLVVIDGPFSLFESVAKYGLQLALVLPALEACDEWTLEAEVRWGKERAPLRFKLASTTAATELSPPRLPDEVDALVRSFGSLKTDWIVTPNEAILDLPGVGLCIPDLLFERARGGGPPERVYLEVMGYWSRAAVWQRVELVQAGLQERVLFAVSSRLRVSEEVLDDDLPSALYVYKGTMNARSIAERLDALASPRETSLP